MKKFLLEFMLLSLLPWFGAANAQEVKSVKVEPIDSVSAFAGPIKKNRAILYFSKNLGAQDKVVLDSLSEFMKNNPNCRLRICGHWDSQCSPEEAEKNSREIADCVVKYIVKKGIARRRLLDSAAGSREPVAENSSPEGRKKNRRVEIEIIKK